MFDVATETERFQMGPDRAGEWGNKLTHEVYLGRNDVLYAHPFGKKRITTYVWRDQGKIVTSMDVLDIDLVVNRPELKQSPGILIANVVTPKEMRGKGYATEMLKAYFAKAGEVSGVLYSDVGAPFYQRFGFHEKPMSAVSEDVVYTDVCPESVGWDEGLKHVDQARWAKVRTAEGPSLALQPDSLFWDWQIERYRYFAQTAKRKFPSSYFWREKEIWVFAVPQYLFDQMDVFWMSEYRPDVLSAIAKKYGVSQYVFWSDRGEGKAELPMARLHGGESTTFLDPQLCDWW